MDYEKLWRSLKKFSGHRIVAAETHVNSDSTIKNMMIALEVHEQVAQKNKKEAPETIDNTSSPKLLCPECKLDSVYYMYKDGFHYCEICFYRWKKKRKIGR